MPDQPNPIPPDDLSRRLTIARPDEDQGRSEEHTSELQSRLHLVCRLLLEKKKQIQQQLKSCPKPRPLDALSGTRADLPILCRRSPCRHVSLSHPARQVRPTLVVHSRLSF